VILHSRLPFLLTRSGVPPTKEYQNGRGGEKEEVKNQKSRGFIIRRRDAAEVSEDPDSLIRGFAVGEGGLARQVLAGGWPTKSLNV
jgi:hypothetical protein